MKLHQEDPRLTAYMLGELPPEEALAVEHAIAGDPALRLVLAEAEKTQAQLQELLGGGKEELLPRQRDHIRRAAKEAARKGKIVQLPSHRKARKAWAVPLAVAAAVAFGIFILTQLPATKPGTGIQVSGNKGPQIPPTAMPVKVSGGSVRLPLHAARESLAKISNSVRVGGRLPSIDEVSVPEMLNAFPLKANGSVALKGGCKLGAEILPCPWKPSGSLIFIEVHAAKDGERALTVEYRDDGGSVIAHRLIGYPAASGEAEGKGVSKMPASSTMLLIISVESKNPDLGKLVWSVDGEEAPSVPLVRDPEKEPSADARFAALVSGFGMWLRGEDSASLDAPVLLGMAREVAADGMAADRYDFLALVDQAVKLTGN